MSQESNFFNRFYSLILAYRPDDFTTSSLQPKLLFITYLYVN